MAQIVTFGEGGYDPTKPNNNIVEIKEVPDNPAEQAREEAIAKLEKLGLTVDDIRAILG